MIPAIRIDPEFHGPTLCELMPILDDLHLEDKPMEVRWGGFPMDYVWLEKAKLHRFILVVPDLDTQEKTLWKLGGALLLSKEEVDSAQQALFSTTNQAEWRKRIAEQNNLTRSTMLLCRIIADTLKAGVKIRPSSAAIARECLLEHTHPADADVLLRLRARNR